MEAEGYMQRKRCVGSKVKVPDSRVWNLGGLIEGSCDKKCYGSITRRAP